MSLALKLTVDQISTAILLLNSDEKTTLSERLPVLMKLPTVAASRLFRVGEGEPGDEGERLAALIEDWDKTSGLYTGVLMKLDSEEWEETGWLSLAESAFDFWNEPEEDVYDDLVVSDSKLAKTIS